MLYLHSNAVLVPLVLALPLLAACQRAGDSEPSPATVDSVAPAAEHDTVDAAHLITPEGIGAARADMTVAELRAALPIGTNLGPPEPFMVDIVGLPVVRGPDTLYYALFPTGQEVTDSSAIPFVATRNPVIRTADGIGPGSTLERAATVYGPPTLSYNTSNESREFAAFAAYPHPEVRFRVEAGDGERGLAGRYSTHGEFNQTKEYDPGARIIAVQVDLRPARKPDPSLAIAPWSAPPIPADRVPAAYLTSWRAADNRASCALLVPAALGQTRDAKARVASFAGGWGVAYDFPELRSAFGVAGTGVDGDESSYSDWPYHQEWADGSSAGYGPEGGSGPNQLAYLRIAGEDCLYNVWSRLGRSHLEFLLTQLRRVNTAS